jgi:hypothetical protein
MPKKKVLGARFSVFLRYRVTGNFRNRPFRIRKDPIPGLKPPVIEKLKYEKKLIMKNEYVTTNTDNYPNDYRDNMRERRSLSSTPTSTTTPTTTVTIDIASFISFTSSMSISNDSDSMIEKDGAVALDKPILGILLTVITSFLF